MDGGEGEAAGKDLHELRLVVGDPAPRASQGEGGADDHGEAHLPGEVEALLYAPHKLPPGHLEADPLHGLLEGLPVLPLPYGLRLGPDELHAIFLQDALLVEGHGQVEARLPPQGGKEGVGGLPGEDALQVFQV